jgi:phosphocarrier protein NPr/phosphocarrier protein
MITRQLTITNKLGLHARAAAKLVAIASRHDSRIEVIHGERRVDARSIMGLLTLGAARGTEVAVTADGQDADAAMAEIEDLFARRFDEQ